MPVVRAGDPTTEADGEVDEGDGAGTGNRGREVPHAQPRVGEREGQQKLREGGREGTDAAPAQKEPTVLIHFSPSRDQLLF